MRVFKSKETALAWGAAAVAMVRSLQVCASLVMRVPDRPESLRVHITSLYYRRLQIYTHTQQVYRV